MTKFTYTVGLHDYDDKSQLSIIHLDFTFMFWNFYFISKLILEVNLKRVAKRHVNLSILKSDSPLVPKHTGEMHRNEHKWAVVMKAFGDYVIVSPVIVILVSFSINCAALIHSMGVLLFLYKENIQCVKLWSLKWLVWIKAHPTYWS